MSRSWSSGEKKGKRKRNALRKEREKNRRKAKYMGELRKQALNVVNQLELKPPPSPPSAPPPSLMSFGVPDESK